MKNIADLEQEKEKLLQELEQLKKQIQQDLHAVEQKYTSQNIAKSIKKEFSKQYLTKRNLALLGIGMTTVLFLYLLSKRKKRKKNTILIDENTKKDKKSAFKPVVKKDKNSFVSELAKEIIWTVTLEVIRKKVNEYIKKKSGG